MHAERALVCLVQHFGSQLVEYERNMAEQTRQEAGANRAEVTSAIEAVAANNAQLVALGNDTFEQRDGALRQTVRVELDGYRAHIAVEMKEDIPAHVEARIAEVRDFFRGQFNEGARRAEQHAREHCEMFAAALREEVHRELFSVEDSNDCWTLFGFLRVSMKSLLWLRLLREIVVENAKEECETVFCATGIKVPMFPSLNESCMSLSGMSAGPNGQTSAPVHEFNSANVSNEVCYKSCILHKSIYSALQRDHCVCFDSHSGSPAGPALCNVNCPGNFSQFCGGDSWYPFHLMYLWVAPVEANLFWNAGASWKQHANVHDSLSRCVVRKKSFEIKCASVSHVAHAEVQSLCQERTENSECDIFCIDGYTIASNTLKCKAVDFETALGTWTGNVSCTSKSCGVPPSHANTLHTVQRYYLDFVAYNCKSGYSLNGLRYGKKEFLLGCKSDGTHDVCSTPYMPANQLHS